METREDGFVGLPGIAKVGQGRFDADRVVAPAAVIHLHHACSLHDDCFGRARFREPPPPRSQP
jgi:hypothetical protein